MAVGDPEGDWLHQQYNRPEPPKINGRPIEYPPYVFQAFPAAIYGPWTDERKRQELLTQARIYSLDLTKPLEREQAESTIAEWDTRLVHSDRERQDWLDKGWANAPDEVKAAQSRYLDRIADAAAVRAHDDRRMGEQARAEMTAADRASDSHILDLPVPPANKRRGRPSKSEAAPTA